MRQPPQITFRHMDASPAVESRIQEEVQTLQQFCSRITSCRVVVEEPHRHHQRAKGFHVSIDLHVPGSVIVVNHEPSLHGKRQEAEAGNAHKHLEVHSDHKDVYVAIRDAFAAARRQLEDFTRVQRGDTKHHVTGTVMV